MESSTIMRARRLQAQANYALIEVLIGLAVTAWQAASLKLSALAAERRQARARRELRGLSDHFLKDIGITRHEIDSLFR
jgi:uncharacterized protein YjiS (DUF1127 family)